MGLGEGCADVGVTVAFSYQPSAFSQKLGYSNEGLDCGQ